MAMGRRAARTQTRVLWWLGNKVIGGMYFHGFDSHLSTKYLCSGGGMVDTRDLRNLSDKARKSLLEAP